MADANRTSTHAVALYEALEREPYKFDFYQVLRQLECLFPDKPRLGESASPADDPIRLGQEPSLAFAPSTVHSLQRQKEGGTPRLMVEFLGLLGPHGPLPLHLTEYIRDRLRNADDPTFARFLDIFHHRMLCLFYRGWSRTRPAVQHDRPETDRFADYLGAFMGIGDPVLRNRDAVPDIGKLHFTGLFACGTRNAEGLGAVITCFFQLPGRIEEFVARWIDLPADCLCRLGEARSTGTLGLTAMVGHRVWDCVQTFRIVLGPLGLEQFRRFLPGQSSLLRLNDMVRNYLGEELGWQIQLILKEEEVPRTALGQAGQLGWTTWLANESRDGHADDLVLDVMPCVT